MEYKFNTKFKVGDIVYTLFNNKIVKVKINHIEAHISITYCDNSTINIKYALVLHNPAHTYLGYRNEEDLHKTKEELIKKLILIWKLYIFSY